MKLRCGLALVAVLLIWPVRAQETAPQFCRVFPLNRLDASRNQGPPPGFHSMHVAIGDDYFDGTSPLARVQRHLARARQLGVKYIRCAFSWNAIEKKQGEYDWTFWDALVDMAQQNGIQLIPYVAYTPKWAATEPKQFWKQPPRVLTWYGDFMYTIAARYRGRIGSWEIWNEPDNQDYWTGTADEFASLAELAARRVRDADSNAVLVLGGMAYGPGKFFQRLIAVHRIDQYFDVIAMHAYPESWETDRAEVVLQQWVPAMRELIENDHSGAALWVNEMGYPDYRLSPARASIYGTSVFYEYEHTRAYQAAMLFKFEVMALASDDVKLAGWYRIDDFPLTEKRLGSDLVNYHLGLLDTRGHPKPALYALRFFSRIFAKPVRVLPTVQRGPNSQAIVDVFQTSDGEIIIVGWLRSSEENEVAHTTGMLADNRRETVSVKLPCSSAKLLGFYNASGKPVNSPARIHPGELDNLQLRGDRVVIAKFSCTIKSARDNPPR